jgi:hypothetical protein
MRNQLDEEIEELRQDSSDLRVIQSLKDALVSELDDFSLSDSDINEHKLNMIIRNLEEDLDRIESEKLHDWNPEED